MNGDVAWPPTRCDQIRRLWNEGHSTAEIGRRMGLSKNAVVGKAHRLNLPTRPSPIDRRGPSPERAAETLVRAARKATAEAQEAARVVREAELAAVVGTSPARVSGPSPAAVSRPSIACCWPLGEPGTPSFRFCEVPAAPGKPYCDAHVKVGYVTVPVRSGRQTSPNRQTRRDSSESKLGWERF